MGYGLSEVRERKSEVRSQKSEVGDQRSEGSHNALYPRPQSLVLFFIPQSSVLKSSVLFFTPQSLVLKSSVLFFTPQSSVLKSSVLKSSVLFFTPQSLVLKSSVLLSILQPSKPAWGFALRATTPQAAQDAKDAKKEFAVSGVPQMIVAQNRASNNPGLDF